MCLRDMHFPCSADEKMKINDIGRKKPRRINKNLISHKLVIG
jgi:hypothetical protein